MPSVARVTEISAKSEEGFQEAIGVGIKRATESLRNVQSAYVKELRVALEDGEIRDYQVNLQVTFELDT